VTEELPTVDDLQVHLASPVGLLDSAALKTADVLPPSVEEGLRCFQKRLLPQGVSPNGMAVVLVTCGGRCAEKTDKVRLIIGGRYSKLHCRLLHSGFGAQFISISAEPYGCSRSTL
jgi:hypothetical protein